MSDVVWYGLYWAVGFFWLVWLARDLNHGLSIMDVVASAVGAFLWPALALIMLGASILFKAPWLMEARYFKKLGSTSPASTHQPVPPRSR